MSSGGELLIPRFCSQCGYDLRGSDSERCPECGFEIALQAAVVGEIPWTFRRVHGRIRSFVRTVVQVVRGGPWIGRVVEYPIALNEARSFRRVAATICALPFIGGFIALWILAGDLHLLVYLPDAYLTPLYRTFPTAYRPPLPFDVNWPASFEWNVMFPLSAGWTLPGVGLFAIWLTMLMGCGVQAYFFAPRACPEPRRSRAYAFSYYLCARLVPVAIPLAGVVASILWAVQSNVGLFSRPTICIALCLFIAIAGVGIWYVHTLILLRRLTLCRKRHVLLAAIGLPAGWLASAVVGLGFVPWSIGYLWSMYDATIR